MFNLPNTPVNSAVIMVSAGVLGVTGYFVRKSSSDRQHLIDAQLKMKEIDAEQQANTLSILKEMATKSFG